MSDNVFEAATAVYPAIIEKAVFFQNGSKLAEKERAAATRKELLDCQLELASLLESGTQGWKFEVLVAGLLGSKIREKAEVPDVVLTYFSNALISDSLKLRHLAVRATSFILAVTKQRPMKVPFTFGDDGTIAQVEGPPVKTTQAAVSRKWSPRSTIDHFPHCYSTASVPDEAEFTSTVFVDKNYIGWSLFPETIQTYPPLSKQPLHEPSKSMALTWEVISRPGFLEQHCYFFSQDKADGTAARFSEAQAELYKGLARNHGLNFLTLARPCIEELLAQNDTDGVSETTAKFRCAGELLAGIVRGSKHWRYDDLQKMWSFVIPTLESAMARIEHNTIGNFASTLRYCVYDRDPRRFIPLSKLFFTPISLATDQGDTSFAQYVGLLAALSVVPYVFCFQVPTS